MFLTSNYNTLKISRSRFFFFLVLPRKLSDMIIVVHKCPHMLTVHLWLLFCYTSWVVVFLFLWMAISTKMFWQSKLMVECVQRPNKKNPQRKVNSLPFEAGVQLDFLRGALFWKRDFSLEDAICIFFFLANHTGCERLLSGKETVATGTQSFLYAKRPMQNAFFQVVPIWFLTVCAQIARKCISLDHFQKRKNTCFRTSRQRRERNWERIETLQPLRGGYVSLRFDVQVWGLDH